MSIDKQEPLIEQGGTSILLHAGEAHPHCQAIPVARRTCCTNCMESSIQATFAAWKSFLPKSLMNELRQDGWTYLSQLAKSNESAQESLGVFNMSLSKQYYG